MHSDYFTLCSFAFAKLELELEYLNITLIIPFTIT